MEKNKVPRKVIISSHKEPTENWQKMKMLMGLEKNNPHNSKSYY